MEEGEGAREVEEGRTSFSMHRKQIRAAAAVTPPRCKERKTEGEKRRGRGKGIDMDRERGKIKKVEGEYHHIHIL